MTSRRPVLLVRRAAAKGPIASLSMGLGQRLRDLDRRVGRTGAGGGFIRARRDSETVEEHLRHIVANGAFGTSRVAEDVLAVLDRVAALKARVAALEKRG